VWLIFATDVDSVFRFNCIFVHLLFINLFAEIERLIDFFRLNFFSQHSDGLHLPLAWSIQVRMIVVFCGFGIGLIRLWLLWLGNDWIGIFQGLVGDVYVGLRIEDGVGSLFFVVDRHDIELCTAVWTAPVLV